MAALRRRHHLRPLAGRLTGRLPIRGTAALLAGPLLAGLLLAGGAAAAEIVVNPGRYGDYYHLTLSLGAADIDFAASSAAARAGGQFEIRLRQAALPVPAPACDGPLILRMPWSDPKAEGAGGRIAAKRALLARMRGLRDALQRRVEVVVELNPYVERLGRDPLRLRLTGCNLFFRHARGGYVPHSDPLPPR